MRRPILLDLIENRFPLGATPEATAENVTLNVAAFARYVDY